MSCDHCKAIELAKAGNWDEAHEMVQPFSDKMSCLIHGYLHRVEGDLGNAGYWYSRGGESMPDNSPEEELERLSQMVN